MRITQSLGSLVPSQKLVSDPARQTEVSVALEQLECAITAASEYVSTLTARLDPVLRPGTPETAPDCKKAEVRGCTLANAIEVKADKIRVMSEWIAGIIERLEI